MTLESAEFLVLTEAPAFEFASVRSFCCGLLEGFDCLSLCDMTTSVNSSNFTDVVGSNGTERKQRDGEDLWRDGQVDQQTR